MPQVIIRHPKTGAEYGIQLADFRRREAGFRIVSLADGSPYEQPALRKAD